MSAPVPSVDPPRASTGVVPAIAGRSRARRPPGGGSNRAGLALFACLLVVLVHWRSGNFATLSNLTSILLNTSAILIASIALARLLIAGAVDLSVGGIYAFVAVTTALVARSSGSTVAAVLVAVTVGTALGTVNGLVVRLLRVSSIIVTLVLGAAYRGLALIVTDARSVTGLPDSFVQLGRARVLGVPLPVVASTGLFVLGALALQRTVGGLRSYAVGGSPRAAQLAGIHVDRHRLLLHAYVGASMGAVAVLGSARLGSGTPTIGAGFEIDVLTAVILGGVSFAGGRGRPAGVLVGVLTIGIVNAGMIFVGLTDFFQQVAKGTLLLAALGADQYLASRSLRRRAAQDRPLARADPTVAPEDVEVAASGCPVEPDVAAMRTVPLEGTRLGKSYGPVIAVDDVSLQLRAGAVVCLVGDNGAGKSTIIRLLTGVERPDRGRILLWGQPVELAAPAQAREAGIEAVHQDLALCPDLSAADNLALGREPRRFAGMGSLAIHDRTLAAAEARQRLAELGVALDDVGRPVSELSGGQRQSVAIARAIRPDAHVIVLDEPTAALGVAQTAGVLRLTRRLAARGVAVLMVTHDVDAVMEVADHVVVLSLGRVLFDGPTSELTTRDLVHLMAGLPRDSPARPTHP